MKRLSNSDSFDALISTCPSTEEKSSRSHNTIKNNGFQIQSMLEGFEEEGYLDESSRNSEKKRRLNVDQVKALERNFEVANKLEPERKMKLAQELGLQPRQVAIWFQNRRARWKAKQLEKDYGILKADYENLKQNFDSIRRDKEALLAELRDLKPKFQEANPESEHQIKEMLVSESENEVSKSKTSTMDSGMQDYHPNYNNNGVRVGIEVSVFGEMKDGVSDSDSSAILNEDNNNNNSPNPTISSSEFLQPPHLDMLPIVSSSPIFKSSSSSTINGFNFLELTEISESTQRSYKMEQHNFSADETCNLFSDEEDPTLQWYYCSDQWN